MDKVIQTISKRSLLFAPLLLSGNVLLNLLLCLFAPNLEELYRKLIVYGFLFVVAVCALPLVKFKDNVVKYTLFVFGLCVLINIIAFYTIGNGSIISMIKDSTINMFMVFYSYIICLAIYSINGFDDFLIIGRRYTYIMSTVAAGYLIYHYLTWNIDFFDIAYMPLSYMFLDYIVFIFIYIILSNREGLDKKNLIFPYTTGILITAAIVVSDCKGAILSELFGCFVLFVYCLFINRKKDYRWIVLLTVILALESFGVYYINSTNSRMKAFLSEVNGNSTDTPSVSDVDYFETSSNDDWINQTLEWVNEIDRENELILSIHPELREDDEYDYIVYYTVYSEYFNEDYENGLINDRDSVLLIYNTKTLNYTNMGARKLLYGRSLKMIMDHPFIGNGIGSFQSIYKNYPHNVLLEAWVDMGALGLIWQFLVLVSYFVIALRLKKVDKERYKLTVILFVYSSFFAFSRVLSGSIYSLNGIFIEATLISLVVWWRLKQIKFRNNVM